jgi:hypothetical protein
MSVTPALTLKRQPWRSSELLAALEECWQQVTVVHPTLPAAVLTIGAREPEVFIGAEGLVRGPEALLGTLLPWRRGRIQSLGMPSSDRASSCSARWNVGNPKGCQSDVGNLDGCPHRVISTGGHWMWNPNAAATTTSRASNMKHHQR